MALEQINDAKYDALRTGGYVGSLDDMFQRLITTATGFQENTEYEFWKQLYPAGVGGLNDVKYQYFGSLGYTGDIQSREYQYWSNLVL